MLEHLRMGPLKRTKATNDASDDGNGQKSHPQQQGSESNQEKQQQQTSSPLPHPPQQQSSRQDRLSKTFDFFGSCNSGVLTKGNGTILMGDDDVDNSQRISVVINETSPRKKSLKEIPNGVVTMIEVDKKFDPRKRYSIGNGDLRINGKSRELSPTPRTLQQQRKLSADMRLRGSNSALTEEYLMRRPVRLKSMCTNFEVYDSLHTKAIDVSTIQNMFFVLLNLIYRATR